MLIGTFLRFPSFALLGVCRVVCGRGYASVYVPVSVICCFIFPCLCFVVVSKKLLMDMLHTFPTVDKTGHFCSSSTTGFCCDNPGTFEPYQPDPEGKCVPVGFYIVSYSIPSIFSVLEKCSFSKNLLWVYVLSSSRWEI